MTAGLGTPTNRAWRQAAIADKVPQVLVMTGDPIFSDTKQSPWQLGFVPKYQNEGEAMGKLLATSTGQHKVAILSQNDDYGKGYVEGFQSAIKGKSNIQVVKQLTYEATDTSVDAQITELASSGADVFFNAMSVTPLMISSLQKAQQLELEAELVPAVQHLQPRCDPRARRRRGLPRHLLRRVREGAGEPGLRLGPGRDDVPGGPQAVRRLPGPAGVPALPVELDGRRDARPGLPEDDRRRPATAS